MDTDAAGIYHYSTVLRLAEAAEAVLHTELGVADITFGGTPRVHIEFDFHTPVRFNDEVATTITVAALGRSSISYDIAIARGAEPVASGRIVAVFIDRATGRSREWPDRVRSALGADYLHWE